MLSKEEQQIKLYSRYSCSQCQNVKPKQHYTVFYSVEFNIETGNKSPDNTQGTWCGDCVDIFVDIYDKYRAD